MYVKPSWSTQQPSSIDPRDPAAGISSRPRPLGGKPSLPGPGPALEANDFVWSSAGVAIHRPWAEIDLWEFLLGSPPRCNVPTHRASRPFALCCVVGSPMSSSTGANGTVFERVHLGTHGPRPTS